MYWEHVKIDSRKADDTVPATMVFFLNKVALKIENGMCAHLLYILN